MTLILLQVPNSEAEWGSVEEVFKNKSDQIFHMYALCSQLCFYIKCAKMHKVRQNALFCCIYSLISIE